MNSLSIHVSNIQYGISETKLFANESFYLNLGKPLILKRDSGYGKSTFFRALSGLKFGTDSTVQMNGTIGYGDHFLLLQNWKNKIDGKPFFSLMTQQTYLLPWKTVEENIRLAFLNRAGSLPSHIQRDLIKKNLDAVDLNGFEKRYIFQLSGGQKTRVNLVRTLCQDRPALLLDEPFAALNQQLKSKIFDFLKSEVHEKKKFLMISSHDQLE